MSTRRSWGLIAAILLAGPALHASQHGAPSGRSPGPIVMERDFGFIESGRILEHPFSVRNDHDRVLRVTGGKVSCTACVKFTQEWSEIRPGETKEVVVQVDTSGKRGPTSQWVFIALDDAVVPFIRLKMKAVVRGAWLAPSRVNLGTLDAGRPASLRIDVLAAGLPHHRLARVEAGSRDAGRGHVEVRRLPDEHRPLREEDPAARVVGAIEVTWSGTASYVGQIAETVTVSLETSGAPPATVSVEATVVGFAPGIVATEPSRLYFGSVSLGDNVVRRITLDWREFRECPPGDLSISATHALVTARIAPPAGRLAGPSELIVTLDVGSNPPPGILRGSLVGRCGNTGVFALPYTALVRRASPGAPQSELEP